MFILTQNSPNPNISNTRFFAIISATLATAAGLLYVYLQQRNKSNSSKKIRSNKKKRIINTTTTTTTFLPSGLINIGNSCYLNGVIQLLASAGEEIVKHFSGSSSGSIGNELVNLIKRVNSGQERVIRPLDFISSFSGSNGTFSLEQQDAHEFLLALLNLKVIKSPLKTGLSLLLNPRNNTNSFIKSSTPFSGVLLNELNCFTCACKRRRKHVSSLNVELFSCITLTQKETISAALYDYLRVPEKYSDYRNECGKGVIKGKHLLVLPQILFLHVSLLTTTYHKMKSESDMGPEEEVSGPGYRYQLAAFLVHFGASGSAGHFVCYRKHQQNWVECNDSSVKIVNYYFISTLQPYILLYKKIE